MGKRLVKVMDDCFPIFVLVHSTYLCLGNMFLIAHVGAQWEYYTTKICEAKNTLPI
jgi:hypothetical protein